ncbi:MAG: cyclic nucleotide-binding domain-containing protein, partial [Spirochaetales bacterium]
EFNLLFDTHDLVEGAWNDVDGMEVMPILSPHPLETTILRFRAHGPDGTVRTYAHYADLSSFKVIDSMTTDDPDAPGLSPADAADAKAAYLEPADLKKVDVGGGIIHGEAQDFTKDSSEELLLSHGVWGDSAKALNNARIAAFGESRLFFPLEEDWQERAAGIALGQYFPTVPQADLDLLASCPVSTLAAGEVLCRKDDPIQAVYLTLGGRLERFDDHGKSLTSLRAGALVNALEHVRGHRASASFKAAVDTVFMTIPGDDFRHFVTRNNLAAEFERIDGIFTALSACSIFAELKSMPGFVEIASAAKTVSVKAGELLDFTGKFLVVISGRAVVFGGTNVVNFTGPGDVCGEHSAFGEDGDLFRARAFDDLTAYAVPVHVVVDKPLILWKLRERYEQRLAVVKSEFCFRWRPEYSMGLPEIDESHESLFQATESIMLQRKSPKDRIKKLWQAFNAHFIEEEQLMAETGYPDLAAHHEEHLRLLVTIEKVEGQLNSGESDESLANAMKECLIHHTLIMDRRYLPWVLPGKGVSSQD